MENDLISRSALFKKIQPVDFLYGDDEAPAYSGMAVSAGDIESAPAVDAVQVVRCKNCKYYKQNEYSSEDDMWCMNGTDWLPTEPDDFCSFGERKESAD